MRIAVVTLFPLMIRDALAHGVVGRALERGVNVVVGTTGDPATPFAWARSVARQLPHGNLITFEGDDHVAYFYSECVRDAVQTYFVEKVPPKPGLVCTD